MRELLERLTRQEPLQEFLASLVRWVESRCPGGGCAVSLVEADGRTVSEVVAPQLTPQSLASGPVGSSVIRGVGGRVLRKRSPIFWITFRSMDSSLASKKPTFRR